MVLTVILSAVIRTIEWLFFDKGTVHSVLASFSTDVLKTALGTAAGLSASLVVAGASVAATVAVLPLATGIGVALLVGMGLDALDNHFQLTQKLVDALARQHQQWKLQTEPARRDLRYYFGTAQGQLSFVRFFSRGGW